MKKNKGFTLVELIGIISIIAILLTFVTPSIIGMFKRDEEREYNRFLNDIYLATESYIQIHIDSYPELSNPSQSVTILMQELIENGYLKSSEINPRTKQRIHTMDTIQVTKNESGAYDYQYRPYQE